MNQTAKGLDIIQTAAFVQEAASLEGFTKAPFVLLRLGTNIVFRSMDNAVVARVTHSLRITTDQINTQLHLVDNLIQNGAPFLKPLGPASLLADGRPVTFWPACQLPSISARALGTLTAKCHMVEHLPKMPLWSPSSHYGIKWRDRSTLMGELGVPADIYSFLQNRLTSRTTQVNNMWRELNQKCHPQVLLHGDIYPGNVVMVNNNYLFIDLDHTSFGPPEADLASPMGHYRRMRGSPNNLALFRTAYGLPIHSELLQSITEADETIQICWLASLWGQREGIEAEIYHRVETLNDPDALWHEF